MAADALEVALTYLAGAIGTGVCVIWYIIDIGALRRSHPDWIEWIGALAFYGRIVLLWPVAWGLWLLNWLGSRVSITF